MVAPARTDSGAASLDSLRGLVRAGLGGARFVRPAPVRAALVTLGQALAFDPILSGPKNISCMTCHQPAYATGDGRSLAVGQGGSGVGPMRTMTAGQSFTPRNAPPLFNLVGRAALFHDGRVEALADGSLRTPAGAQLSPEMRRVFEFGALSAVPLFPVLDRVEMRGRSGNELASIADDDMTQTWAALMLRLGTIAEYRAMFEAAYPGTPFASMTFAHASNAIAGFLVQRLTLVNSPLQAFLGGDDSAMTHAELQGGGEFLDRECNTCHSGALFADARYHNTGLPQIGPGTGVPPTPLDDYGRAHITGNVNDRYKFRTASLLNVELTAPYGHAGQFARLDDFVLHYDRPKLRFSEYDVAQLESALRPTLVANGADVLASIELVLTVRSFDATTGGRIVAFLRALTDPSARALHGLVPARVPSGLPVDHP